MDYGSLPLYIEQIRDIPSNISISAPYQKDCIMATKKAVPIHIEDVQDANSTEPSDNGKAEAATQLGVNWDAAEERKLVYVLKICLSAADHLTHFG